MYMLERDSVMIDDQWMIIELWSLATSAQIYKTLTSKITFTQAHLN